MGKDPGSEGTRGDKGRLGQRAAMAAGSPQPANRRPAPSPQAVPATHSASRRRGGRTPSPGTASPAPSPPPPPPPPAARVRRTALPAPLPLGNGGGERGPAGPAPQRAWGGVLRAGKRQAPARAEAKPFATIFGFLLFIFFTIFFLSAVENRP